ncbi:unnamed protein product, partial [Prorocentrum cordatum]
FSASSPRVALAFGSACTPPPRILRGPEPMSPARALALLAPPRPRPSRRRGPRACSPDSASGTPPRRRGRAPGQPRPAPPSRSSRSRPRARRWPIRSSPSGGSQCTCSRCRRSSSSAPSLHAVHPALRRAPLAGGCRRRGAARRGGAARGRIASGVAPASGDLSGPPRSDSFWFSLSGVLSSSCASSRAFWTCPDRPDRPPEVRVMAREPYPLTSRQITT